MTESNALCSVCHCENEQMGKACMGCAFGRNENADCGATFRNPVDAAAIVHQKLLALANLKTEPVCEDEAESWQLTSHDPRPISVHDDSFPAMTSIKTEAMEVATEGASATNDPFSLQYEALEENILLKQSPMKNVVQESSSAVALEKKPLELQSSLSGVHQTNPGGPVDLSLKAPIHEVPMGLNHEQVISAGTPGVFLASLGHNASEASGDDSTKIRPFVAGTLGDLLFLGQKASETSGEDSTKPRPFACEICSMRYFKRADLTRHIRSHTGEKPFPCPHCSARFARKTYLQSHMRTHTGERPFACRHCEAKFAEKGARKVHERTHTGERPYGCSFCDAKFAKAYNMKRHVRSHTGFKPFECSECQAKFSDSGDLKKHQVIHSGVRPFICSVCDDRFLRKHDLRSHQITHKNDKVYECEVCGMKFARVTYLQRHMKVHGRVGRRIKKLEGLDLADPDVIFDTRGVEISESKDESMCENRGNDGQPKQEMVDESVEIQKFSFRINRLSTIAKSKPKSERTNDRNSSDDREKSPRESRDGSSEYNLNCQTVLGSESQEIFVPTTGSETKEGSKPFSDVSMPTTGELVAVSH